MCQGDFSECSDEFIVWGYGDDQRYRFSGVLAFVIKIYE